MAHHSTTYNSASTNATSAGSGGTSAGGTTTSSDQNFDYMFKLLIIGYFINFF